MTLAAQPFTTVPPGATRRGLTPAVLLVDPRFARNVGVAVRAASCYGARQVWFTRSFLVKW